MGLAVGADLRHGGVYHSICANAKNSGLIRDGIVYAVSMDGKSKADAVADISNALTVPDKQSKVTVVIYDARGNGRGGGITNIDRRSSEQDH